jgi:hypothetical protein
MASQIKQNAWIISVQAFFSETIVTARQLFPQRSIEFQRMVVHTSARIP